MTIDNRLHLSVAVRSIRSTKLAEWVENVLNLKPEKAKEIKEDGLERYPIYITRSIDIAKRYLKYEKNDLERKGRYGL